MQSKRVCSFVGTRFTRGANVYCWSHAHVSHLRHTRFSSRANLCLTVAACTLETPASITLPLSSKHLTPSLLSLCFQVLPLTFMSIQFTLSATPHLHSPASHQHLRLVAVALAGQWRSIYMARLARLPQVQLGPTGMGIHITWAWAAGEKRGGHLPISQVRDLASSTNFLPSS